MRVTLLGTQGWIPTEGRETTCFAVEDGTALLLFDAGTGLRRLVSPPWRHLIERSTEIHLFLTHYHLDHVCGLAYFQAVFQGRRVTVHAPHESVTGVDPSTALGELIRPPFNPRRWAELPNVTLVPLREGVTEVSGHRIAIRAQDHSDVSVAYRLDDALVIATDTRPDPATVGFAAGARVLLHEAWFLGELPLGDGPGSLNAGYAAHSEALAVARLAGEADVGRLVLVHLNPLLGESEYEAMAAAARDVFANTAVQPDGSVLELDGT